MKPCLSLMVLAVILTATPVNAQWTFGGVLDINLGNISIDPEPSTEDYSIRVGIGVGVVMDRPLSGPLDLHAEPMILQKGTVIKEDGDEITFKATYLEIPVMVRFNFQQTGTVQPYAIAGPSIGILLNSKLDVKGGPELDAKDDTKALDFGIGVGGGVHILEGSRPMFAELRYVLGLANINDDAEDGTTVNNRGIQLLFGVMLSK